MKDVVLVRHAPSRTGPAGRASDRRLAPGAGARLGALADRLGSLGIDLVIAGTEPAAVASGRELAAVLRVPFTSAPRLHELERGHVPPLDERAWQDAVRRSFRNPDVLVFGRETANEARRRFRTGLERALARARSERPAVVAHGSVMSLVVAEANGLDAFELWRSLQAPEALLVGWPDLRLRQRIAAP